MRSGGRADDRNTSHPEFPIIAEVILHNIIPVSLFNSAPRCCAMPSPLFVWYPTSRAIPDGFGGRAQRPRLGIRARTLRRCQKGRRTHTPSLAVSSLGQGWLTSHAQDAAITRPFCCPFVIRCTLQVGPDNSFFLHSEDESHQQDGKSRLTAKRAGKSPPSSFIQFIFLSVPHHRVVNRSDPSR